MDSMAAVELRNEALENDMEHIQNSLVRSMGVIQHISHLICPERDAHIDSGRAETLVL